MRGFNKISILFVLLIVFNVLSAKENPYIAEVDSVSELFNQIANTKSDKQKKEINAYLINYMRDFFRRSESFGADYSKVKNLSVLKSDDNQLKIYTWNLAYSDGSCQYFGFLQHRDKKGFRVYFLDDKKFIGSIEPRLYQTNSEWYGALYYEIITKKWNSTTYYTLIGYDAADFLVNRKVIEVLYFDRRGIPVFGKKLFKLNRTSSGRLVFEYADRVTMILRFNAKQDMIILDHLAPPEQRFTNMYQFYGPDFSFDAFVFKGGKWILQSDIDPNVAINFKRDSKVNNIKRRGVSKDF